MCEPIFYINFVFVALFNFFLFFLIWSNCPHIMIFLAVLSHTQNHLYMLITTI